MTRPFSERILLIGMDVSIATACWSRLMAQKVTRHHKIGKFNGGAISKWIGAQLHWNPPAKQQ
jgi:hypothetical protein